MKTKKLIFISTIIAILLGFNICYAVDLNMTDDLTGNMDLTMNSSMNNTNITGTDLLGNTNANNISTNNSNTSTDFTYDDEELDSNLSTSGSTNTTSYGTPTTISDLNSTSSNGLELSTILNTLLIVIGILLLLLAIAILIRLKQ